MPEVTRVMADMHVGHLCPEIPDFHKTAYATGSEDVLTNGMKTVRIGDTTACGDPAVAGSSSVIVNGKPVHRRADATGGHECWVPNQSESGSPDVIAGD
jgi:uncharacterized Zn-binding protein involved in type VI secretion